MTKAHVDHYRILFADASHAGVYHLPHGDIQALTSGAQAAGCLVQHVDLAQARTKSEMLAQIGKTLGFPDWFGQNWDALLDCLLDMAWRPAEAYVTVLDRCDGVHGYAESDFVVLMQIFQTAAAEWREQNVPFWCLVDMQADGIAWLPTVAQPQ
ncbi:MAG TPA: barstar family protein [Rhodocyclaceae bacterium]|nr:barstar family protein [Rhodocyclaceae bacterium]